MLYDYMEKNESCSMCCHAYMNIDAKTKDVVEEVHTLESDGEITAEKAIQYSNPSQIATQMFRKEDIFNMPPIFKGRGVGDFCKLLYAVSLGDVHYIDEVMACHRKAVEGSWTERIYKNRELRIKHDNSMIDFLRDYDGYTNRRHHETIRDKIETYKFDILIAEDRFKEQKRHECYRNLTIKRKTIIRLGCIFPRLASKIVSNHDF